MEFKDIKNFGKSTIGSDGTEVNAARASVYEDKSDFCRERYVDADLACSCMFSDALEAATFDGITIFWPTEKYVVLNNFKGYSKEVKMNVNTNYTDAEWNKVSTPTLY